MRHYALYDNKNNLVAIGTGFGGTEIIEAKYNVMLSEIREKAALVNRLYSGEITLAEVPTEWQEEIQRRVDERIAIQGTLEEQDISAEEALSIIVGGEA